MKQLEPGTMVMTYKPTVITPVLATGTDQYGEWVEIEVNGEIRRLDRIEVAKVRIKHG